MIRRLILFKQSYIQLTVVLFGSLFGLLMVMSSLQIYQDIRSIVDNKKELISSQFLVVNKPVSILNTLSGSAAVFSEEEIEAFKTLKAVEKVGTFKANQFRAQTGFQLQDKTMMTDMFFEAVPDGFLDVKVSNWNWKPGQPVPIILPTDYLNLYNFGFAPSQGLPQISKGTAKLAGLKVIVSGNGETAEMSGVIAGFTDRINSILVPESFLEETNNIYGSNKEKGISRLVLMCNDPSDAQLTEFLESRGYETNLEMLKNGKLNALLKMVLSIVLIIGSVIVLLAILGFVQYAQLLISNSNYEIRTLLQLGYRVNTIFKQYLLFYIVLMGLVFVTGTSVLLYIKHLINGYMSEKNFEVDATIDPLVLVYGILLVIVFLILNALNTFYRIKQLAK
ncbi:MAG: hypothetical protein RLZ10_2515 [Bacteroidota bacterium]|jgi:hypothetical protein